MLDLKIRIIEEMSCSIHGQQETASTSVLEVRGVVISRVAEGTTIRSVDRDERTAMLRERCVDRSIER